MRVVSKHIVKENIGRHVPESDTSKRNLIYNYNYLKKDRDSTKKTLVTLPAQPMRAEAPKDRITSMKVMRANSK